MSQRVYCFADFSVDPNAHALARNGGRVAIQEQPLQILLALLERPGQIVTREPLRRRLWGTDTFVDFDQSLNSAVLRLRLALDDNSRKPVFVETLPRIGFRFIGMVALENPDLTPAHAGLTLLPERRAPGISKVLPQPARERTGRRSFPAAVGVN